MKKKGTTESYSALIGIIIAFLMLTAIGCAVYNMYKPKSPDSFNKLVNKIKSLEKTGNEEGEYPLFLEEDWFVIGFDKTKDFEYKPNCPPFVGSFLNNICSDQPQVCYGLWGCYGFGFSQPPAKEDLPKKILRPQQKCGIGKSCLCLCKIDRIGESEPFLISEQACQRSDAICASFDSINFVGSEGCCHGIFIPGIDIQSARITRGLKALKYKKSGNDVSLRDLSQSDFAKVLEKEKERIVQLSEYLKTRRNVYFVPVNWDSDAKEFDRAVNLHLDYMEERIREVEKILGKMFNSLSTDFNVLRLENLQCKNIDLNKKVEDIEKDLEECLIKSDLKLTNESLKDSIIIGITDDTKVCGITDSERIIVSNYKDPSNTAHGWGHFMLFCDEYKYSEWEKDNRDGLECLNPYPLCCKDHPYWENNLEEYKKYLENEKIGPNCYPGYEELSDKAKTYFQTKEKYEEHMSKSTLCHGHVCSPEDPKNKYCRGLMGPEIKCEDKEVIYSNSLEYSYLDFDKMDDFRILFGIKKTEEP